MLFEPPPRPQDLAVIYENSHEIKKRKLTSLKTYPNTNKNFDIFKDMNIPRVSTKTHPKSSFMHRPRFR